MPIRVPRGYEVSRPYYNELCEGVRPVAGALAKEAWTGLAHTRVDEQHHDPIVLEPGTLVGIVTGGNAVAAGRVVPALMGTGTNFDGNLIQVGASNVWGLPSTSGNHAVGVVKPIGVVYQPIYSFILQAAYTNYTRNTAVGVVTDYVIQVPAVNSDEWAIESGDRIMLGAGVRHGIGFMPPNPAFVSHTAGFHLAGRYAAVKSYQATTIAAPAVNFVDDRVVGRCLRKVRLGSDSAGASAQGRVLADHLATFTIDAAFDSEMSFLSKIQTVPGLTGLTGTGTKGVPGYYLGARADAAGVYWGLTMLIRL
jgi:hypothetical protein